MKIAYVSTLRSSSWGGSEELWYQSAEEAIKRNFEIGVFVYEWPEEPSKLSRLRNKGAFIHKRKRTHSLLRRIVEKIAVGISGKSPYRFNPYKDLVTFKPDIVVVTDGSTYYTANDAGLSYVLLHYFKGKYTIISQANTDYHLPSDRKHAIHLFENALRVFFVSENNRKLADHQLAHRLTRAELIQNPILLDHFEIQPYPAVNGTIHCAVVGRFCISDKGQDILISMFGEDGWKAADIKLHLYGKGEDQEYLEQLIAYYGAGDKVTIEGFSENKNEIWDKCHCLLMCSHSEGTPLTLLEAMVAGRVCIVTRVGGNEEWIEDGENGFLVDAPTGRLFGGKLKEALERVGEWERIGKAAHDHARGKMESNPGKMLVEKIMSARAGSR